MRTIHNKLIQNFLLLLIPIFLPSCGGGGGGGAAAPAVTYYEIRGTIQGLTGTGLGLQNNLGENIAIAPGTPAFTFPTPMANGAAYSITVSQQPTTQICSVNRESGNVSNANVTNILIICSTTSHLVGGTVSGLLGSGLVIRNNNADSKPISVSGPFTFTFTTPVATGAGYNVTVLTHPSSPSQQCVVSNGFGAVFTDITNVAIVCNQSAQHFAYVANSGNNTISMYKINALTGHLQTNGSLTTGASPPQFITVDPDYPNNPYAYVVDSISSTISAYRIDLDFGTLTMVGTSATETSPQPVTVYSNGQFAYVANSGSNTISVYTIAVGTGQLTLAGTIATGTSPQPVQLDPTGQFAYVANSGSDNVSGYLIDTTTGDLAPIGIFPAGSTPQSITIVPSGVFAYVANSATNDISAYYLNGANGQLIPIDANDTTSAIENFSAGDAPRSVTIDPYGRFAYVANSGGSNTISAYKIEVSTGRLILAGTITTGTSPQPVQVDPTGQFAYVANSGSNSVSGYKIDPATGALTSVGPSVAAGIDPRSVSFDALGHFAYVINNGSATLSAYRIDGTTGVLTPVSGSPYAAESKPQAVTIDPLGRFAYVSNRASNTISAYAIDALTRALDPVPGSPFATGIDPQPVTVDPFGVFAYVANSSSDTISAFLIGQSGELSVIGTYPTGDNPQKVTITDGFAYVANNGSSSVSAYVIDGATGELIPVDADAGVDGIQNFAAGINPVSVTIDPFGQFAYVANSTSNNVSAYVIDSASGALTSLGALTTGSGSSPQSVTVDPNGQFAYVANRLTNNIAAYTIDPVTGALTRIDADPDADPYVGAPGDQNFAAGTTPLSVTIAPNGAFAYVANSGSGNVSAYSIDFTGALALIGTVAAGTTPQAVAIDPTGSYAYVSNAGSDNVSAYSINGGTGELMPIQTFAAGDSPVKVSIGIDPITSQLFAYVSNSMSTNVAGNVTAYTINAGTGVLTAVPGSPFPTGSSPTSIAITK